MEKIKRKPLLCERKMLDQPNRGKNVEWNVDFPEYNLHRVTNSAKSQVKIRLTFHFVERNELINSFFGTTLSA